MKNIILTKKQINNLKLLSRNSIGGYGRCYDYKGEVLKIFGRKLDSNQTKKIKKKLRRNSKIIMYPKKRVFLFDKKIKFKGYVCDKAPGVDFVKLVSLIKNGELDITFDEFLEIYYDKFLPLLKKEDVVLKDVQLWHMFWDDGLYLIDTDQYIDRPCSMTKECKDTLNISLLNYEIKNFIMEFISPPLCWDLLHNVSGKESEDYYDLKKVIEILRRFTNQEVNSFNGLFNYKYRDNEYEPVLFDKEEYYKARKQGWI